MTPRGGCERSAGARSVGWHRGRDRTRPGSASRSLRPRWSREFRIGLPRSSRLVALMLFVRVARCGGRSSVRRASRPQGTSSGFASNQTAPGDEPGSPRRAGGSEPMPIVPSGRAGTPALMTDRPTARATTPRFAELQRVLSEGRGRRFEHRKRVGAESRDHRPGRRTSTSRSGGGPGGNPYLRSHLAATMKRKADLLRKATVLASAEGQG
jgi:hypothetical protein